MAHLHRDGPARSRHAADSDIGQRPTPTAGASIPGYRNASGRPNADEHAERADPSSMIVLRQRLRS
jgi:hypothetical protein